MTIAAETIRPDQTVLVRGTVTFSRVASLITGDELNRRIAQQKQRGSLYVTDKEHTTIDILDPKVLAVDPQNPTLEERYVAEKFYDRKSGKNAGHKGFNIDDKSKSLPVVLEKDPQTGNYRQVILEADLAEGMDVTLVLETFQSGGYAKKGLGLANIILNEELKYYQPSINTEALAAHGITIEGGIQRVTGDAAKSVAPAPAEAPDENTIYQDGFALPGPGSAADAAAYAAPAAQAQDPQPQAQAQAPQPQAQPQAAAQGDLTDEQLEQLLAQRKAAKANQGQGDSPFAAQGDQQAPAGDSPWASGGSGITYGG